MFNVRSECLNSERVCAVWRVMSLEWARQVKQPKKNKKKTISKMWNRLGTRFPSQISTAVSSAEVTGGALLETTQWHEVRLHKAAFLQSQYSLLLPSPNLPPTQTLHLAAAAICIFLCRPCQEPIFLSVSHRPQLLPPHAPAFPSRGQRKWDIVFQTGHFSLSVMHIKSHERQG